MRTSNLHPCTAAQEWLYSDFDCNSTGERVVRVIPFAAADVALEVLQHPLSAIVNLCHTTLNLLGAAFSQNYSLRDGLWTFEQLVKSVALTPVEIALAPLKFLYQAGHIVCADCVSPVSNRISGWRENPDSMTHPHAAYAKLGKIQTQLYQSIQAIPAWKRCALAIPVAFADLFLNVIKYPLAAIHNLALATINFLGAAFSRHCSLRRALWAFEESVKSAVLTPVEIALASLKFLYQIGHIVRTAQPRSIGELWDQQRTALPYVEEDYNPYGHQELQRDFSQSRLALDFASDDEGLDDLLNFYGDRSAASDSSDDEGDTFPPPAAVDARQSKGTVELTSMDVDPANASAS